MVVASVFSKTPQSGAALFGVSGVKFPCRSEGVTSVCVLDSRWSCDGLCGKRCKTTKVQRSNAKEREIVDKTCKQSLLSARSKQPADRSERAIRARLGPQIQFLQPGQFSSSQEERA